ncbi:hypothetical protein P692DRAFT_20738687, partial [Suillus brevipes Sb2]
PSSHVSRQARSYIVRYNESPSSGPIFTPAQKVWLNDHIPRYMQWAPNSEETRAFMVTMFFEFNRVWPLHEKLWPGSNTRIRLSDSMRAKLMAEILILRVNIKGHMFWMARRKLSQEKSKTGKEPQRWFWYWDRDVDQT